MKRSALLMSVVFCGLAVLCGCYEPKLAQTEVGEEEKNWERVIKNSYRDNRGPQIAPPTIVDKYSPKMSEEAYVENSNVVPVAAAEDPTVVVENNATEVKAAAPVATPAAVDKKADKANDKAVAPKADAKADAKAEAKVDATAKPELNADNCDVYIVKGGDSLGKIAQKFYGSAAEYEIILKANADKISNPKAIRPGMKLLIPKL